VGKHVENRLLGSPRHRWEDNIKIDLLEVGWGSDWIVLAQKMYVWRDLVDLVMKL
jgi:hypothetical protein